MTMVSRGGNGLTEKEESLLRVSSQIDRRSEIHTTKARVLQETCLKEASESGRGHIERRV